ncbi:CvpA family protein [Roseateles chitosanitabidus]|jgi:membrane protein required for colicin V production|uniref:CvpA family protein n=1 Tax=Roseateles chitosanitabidus TaxID=65048 RepID=UPI00082CA53D|nr:CvpA family protein [Roseateles chitosanitabidus]MBO9687403.1 CvpA family protein [Roseateles chitosanitabidus]
MNWVDIALAGLLVVSVLVGAWRGLVFELMTIAGWVVAYVASPFVAPVIERFIPIEKVGPTLLHALGLVLAFVLVLLIWGIGAKLIRALIHATPLGVLDRLGGAGFGVLRAVLVALLATVIVDMTPAAKSPAWTESQIAPWLQTTLAQVRPLLPEALKDFVPA